MVRLDKQPFYQKLVLCVSFFVPPARDLPFWKIEKANLIIHDWKWQGRKRAFPAL